MNDRMFLLLFAFMLVLCGVPKYTVFVCVAIVMLLQYMFMMETEHVNAYYAQPPRMRATRSG